MRKHVISPLATVNGVICSDEATLQDVINTYTLPPRWGVVTQGSKFLLAATEGGGEIVLPEYQAVLDYATSQGYTLPSAAQQDAQNALVAALVDAGIWEELDLFYNFFTDGSEDFAKINWIAPGTFQITSGETVFTANYGFQRTATSGLNGLDTNYYPGASNVRMQQDNGAIGCDLRDFPSTNFDLCGQNSSTALLRLLLSAFGDGFVSWPGGYITPNVRLSEFHLSQRTPDGTIRYFGNGSLIGTPTVIPISAFDPVQPFTALRSLGQGMNTQVVCACLFAGSSLSGKEQAFYTAWDTYRASV